MTFRTLIRRSLRCHWRAHLGVVLGAAVGSATLIGALVVGDSVRESLRERVLVRFGRIQVALFSGDHLFRAELAGALTRFFSIHADELRAAGAETATKEIVVPVLQLPGTASTPDGAARANRVRVLGVDERFWKLANSPSPLGQIPKDAVILNQSLAERLRVKIGDEVLLRVLKPTLLSQDAPVAPKGAGVSVLRVAVHAVISDAELGRFSLRMESTPPFNAFVPLPSLQEATKETNRANLLLAPPASRLVPKTGFSSRDLARKLLWEHISVRLAKRIGLYDVGEVASPNAVADLQSILSSEWSLDDAEIQLQILPADSAIELRTRRVFLDHPVGFRLVDTSSSERRRIEEGRADFRQHPLIFTNAQSILTYLANLLCAGTNATPYSMVTAAGPPWTPTNMRDDEIFVSQWLAEDLQVKPGDEIALSYFDPESGARLVERTNTFRVRGVVPIEMPWADRTLMPGFPGIEKAESTRDWDAAFPLTYKIRQKDEDYWKQYRGTPKAFITLAAGQKMWANRFGNLTAIRFPIPSNSVGTLSTAAQTSSKDEGAVQRVPTRAVEDYHATLEKKILGSLKPEELGLRFEPAREQALKAAKESQDFGGLFLSFSFFLIAAALLLMALLFSLGLEQRAPEVGTLLALGLTPKQVRNLLLCEGVVVSLLGGVLGTLGGLAYARIMLQGLTTIWRDAIGTSALSFHFTAQSLVIGLFASVLVCAVTIWLILRKFVRRPARELLVGEIQEAGSRVQSLKSKVVAVAALLMALGLVSWTVAKGDTRNASVFFGAGALVLVAGLAMADARFVRLARSGFFIPTPVFSLRDTENHLQALAISVTASSSNPPLPSESVRKLSPLPAGAGQGEGERGDLLSLSALGLRGCARRRKRSLATVAMLACGSFLIVSIGVFRLDANRDAWKRSSGTGGFALIGETTMPVVHDLNSPSGRDFFALNENDLAGVRFVPFRVREGDEASCLNLNRAQKPRLLGVKPEMLEGRFTFANGDGWQSLGKIQLEEAYLDKSEISQSLLRSAATTNVEISAIGDANSIQWAMKKKLGDTIDYVDERGQPFRLRIVGAAANSVLQGQLIIDEAEFVMRFPSESGYRLFLIDAPSNTAFQVSAMLSRAMQDVGLELTPAADRLAQFNAVQNTYLGTFQVLGGLGLLLGSMGLGIIVLRNMLERRGELAVLLAVGFRKATLQRLLLIENGALLAAGLALGVLAAVVAVLPALLSPSAQLPYTSLALTLGAVLVNGALWTWAATRLAVSGDLLKALRNE